MASANITINGLPGSNIDLPIDTLVQLNNINTGGETTYTWAILNQPPGPVDTLSSTSIQNPTFTPRKEGSYLIRLVVNQSQGTEVQQTQVAAVRQMKSNLRVPAAGETIQVDPATGWAGKTPGDVGGVDQVIRMVDSIRADPGLIVAVPSVSDLVTGDVVRFEDVYTLKAGLPGEEVLPACLKAFATFTTVMNQQTLGIVEFSVDGSPPTKNVPCYVRLFGMTLPISIPGASTGDTVYVSNTATVSATPGTTPRGIGFSIVGAAGLFRLMMSGFPKPLDV